MDFSEFIQKCLLKPTFLQSNHYCFPINRSAVASGNTWNWWWLMTALRGTERLQVRGRGGKGQWHNIRKTNRQEWGLILQGLDKFCSVPKVEDLCLSLLLRMKSVWWVIRMFSVSTALTKQRNTVVPFPIATLRPTHQLVAPQGRTDIRAYPSCNKKIQVWCTLS